MNGWLIYETEKLPGFSLGLIALAVGTQLLDNYSVISYITDEESPIEIKIILLQVMESI